MYDAKVCWPYLRAVGEFVDQTEERRLVVGEAHLRKKKIHKTRGWHISNEAGWTSSQNDQPSITLRLYRSSKNRTRDTSATTGEKKRYFVMFKYFTCADTQTLPGKISNASAPVLPLGSPSLSGRDEFHRFEWLVHSAASTPPWSYEYASSSQGGRGYCWPMCNPPCALMYYRGHQSTNMHPIRTPPWKPIHSRYCCRGIEQHPMRI